MFRDMLSKPKDVVVVSAKRRGRPNNPYFEDVSGVEHRLARCRGGVAGGRLPGAR